MADVDDLKRKIVALELQNEALEQRVADAERATAALVGGERNGSAKPLLLQAAQEALRNNELLLRAIFYGALDAMLLADDQGHYVDANPAACELFGLPLEELVGHGIAEFGGLEHDGETVYRKFREQGYMRGQFPLVRADGSTRVLDYSAVANVAPGLHLSVLRDVTDRIGAEDALRRNEALFRAVIEKSTEAMSLTAADGTTRYLTPFAWRQLGFSDEEVIGRTLHEQAIPEDRARITAELERLVRTGARDMHIEFRVLHRDGSIRWIESSGTNLLDDPNVGAIVGNYRDITVRKRSEELAKEALFEADLGRRKLEAVLAALPVGVWIADPAGRLVQSNFAAARIWGGKARDTAAPANYGVYKAFWPADGLALISKDGALARTLRTGETIVAEALDIERFDGSRGHVLNSTAPIYDDQGQMIGGVVVHLDVTDAHEAARERERLVMSLEYERKRLGTLLEKAPAFISVTRGKDHVFELVNEAHSDLTGRRDLIGDSVADRLPELEGQGLIKVLDDVLETGNPFVANGLPIMLVRKPGTEPEQRYVNVVCQPLVEADGTRSGVFVHGVDVTDATTAQQRVRAQFHGVPVPTYVWQRIERDGAKMFVLVDFNKAAVAVAEGGITKHLGESAKSYFADGPELLEDIERCLDQRTTIQREMDRPQKITGESRRLFVTCASAPPDLVIVHAEDITARTMLEEQLRQAQKMEAVGRLAGGVAHDFNNMLLVILSYAEMALEDMKPGDPLREDIEAIQTAAKRATDLTRQLLAFSRQQVLQPRVVDLDEVVTGMKSMLARILGEDIELTIRASNDVWRVLADPGQIEQVVMNLAVNARDAMPDGGELTIELGNVELDAADTHSHPGVMPGQYVMLSTTDTGVGMDAATCANVFEPFFTTKQKGKGTGLGLSTVFGIVEQSHGHVRVQSEEGRGSTFRVYLPRTDRTVHEPSRAASEVVGGSETILLVEDEEQVRFVTGAPLRRNGYRVLEASNGGEALSLSASHSENIQLLLTDVVMPGMNGSKLAEQLALQRPHTKLLFISGYTDDAIVRLGVLDAGVAFLQKPFTVNELLRKVRTVLDALEPRRDESP